MTKGIFGQKTEDYLLKIDNKTISVSDFESAYLKDKENNIQDKITINDFIKSYILLKTKIAEAESIGLDKSPEFLSEYNKYAEKAKDQYTNDTISSEIAAKLIFDRLQENIEIAQIFIPFTSSKTLPNDTLKAYDQIKKIRESVINLPDNEFRKIASQYPKPGYSNEVETSWQTALMGEKRLEDAIYESPSGQISSPIRTNEGYYLIKKYGTRADRGEVRISHMLFLYPENATASEKDSVRNLSQRVIADLNKGLPFDAICKIVSADRSSAEKGGDLGWFSTRSNMIPQFDSIFFSLQKINDYTQPIEFDYGFHIFKLTGKVKSHSWPEIKNDLIKEMKDRHRNGDIQALKIKRLSNKYPYSIDHNVYRKILDIANEHYAADSLFFKELPPIYNKELLTINNQNYTVNDFVLYIYSNLSAESTLSTDIVIEKLNDFVLNRLSKLNEDHIIDTTPELKLLLQEYYDGLLLFAVMDKEVWSKAQNNEKGLGLVFKQNRDKYSWTQPKYKGYIIYLKDQQAFDKAKALENEFGELENFPQRLFKEFSNDSIKPLYIEKGIWAKGENEFVDNILYQTEIKRKVIGYPYFFIHGKSLDQPETFEDVKGSVVRDYQDILENQWIRKITKKHKVHINNQALNRLIKKYNQ